MRKFFTLFVSGLFATPALAHPGHVADHGAGHDHVAALAALALAIVVMGIVGLRAAYRRRQARRAMSARHEDAAA